MQYKLIHDFIRYLPTFPTAPSPTITILQWRNAIFGTVFLYCSPWVYIKSKRKLFSRIEMCGD
jgi:hypothetical protein